MTMDCAPRPFRIAVEPALVERLLARLADMRWPAAPSDDTDWRYGADQQTLRALVAHWITRYDWHRTEQSLNAAMEEPAALAADLRAFFRSLNQMP